MSSNLLSYSGGYYFALPLRIFLFIFTLVTLAGAMINLSVWVVIVALAVAMLMMSTHGAELNIAQGKYRQFVRMGGIKFGTWKDLSTWSALSLFKVRLDRKMQLRGSPSTLSDIEYQIMLLNEDHSRKTEFIAMSDAKKAEGAIEALSKKTGMPIQSYDPPRGRYY